MKRIAEMTLEELETALEEARSQHNESKPRSKERRHAAVRIKNLTVYVSMKKGNGFSGLTIG